VKFLKGLYQPTLDIWRKHFRSSKVVILAFFFIGFLSALYVFAHIREDGMGSDLSISFAMIVLAIWFSFLPALMYLANICKDENKNNEEENDGDDDEPEPLPPSDTGDVGIDKLLEDLTKPSPEKIKV